MRKLKYPFFFLIFIFTAFVFWTYQTKDPDPEIRFISSTQPETELPDDINRSSSSHQQVNSGSALPHGASVSGDSEEFVLPDGFTDSRFLELVNGDHPISAEPDSASIIPVWPGVSVLTTDITLHNEAREAVLQMFEAAKAEQAGSFYVSSGYRSYDEQVLVYDETEDKSLVQLPGHSEHETGLAVDIMAQGVGQYDLAYSPEGKWLADNAHRFGLILRYADGKQNITGIAGEAWHFRYVGEPHSYYCYKNDLCLEEYIDLLQKTGGYNFTDNNEELSVIYVTEEDGAFPPVNGGYYVSKDNTGGYIFTQTT